MVESASTGWPGQVASRFSAVPRSPSRRTQRGQHLLAEQADALPGAQPVRRAELDAARTRLKDGLAVLDQVGGRARKREPAQQVVGDQAGGAVRLTCVDVLADALDEVE